ncbi:MAG TPA: RNA-binding protein [Kofleriaceae bacterium]|nr:RNA-binding protein [Kofleriaceae bacterium]
MRLFVGNLAFEVRADDLRELFASIGEVADVHVVTDRDTGRSRGFAFVTMASGQAAKKAISELDGAVFGERQIRVNQAEERSSGGGGRRRF